MDLLCWLTQSADVTKARWYDSWISPSRRETASSGSLSPTHVASMHKHQESRTTANFEDEHERIQADANKNETSYTPKRLSLVQRFDSTNSPPPLPITAPVPATAPTHIPELHLAAPLVNNSVLSPVTQEDEPPLSHKEEIDSRVKSWRASATPEKTLLTSTGQISLDPVHMPNAFPLDDLVDEVNGIRSEMNIEDHSCGTTSAGPPSIDSPSPTSHHLPSVHVVRRATGSVPLTPETRTSWGPEDYDPLSPLSSESRVTSLDIGQRVRWSRPVSIATSWGPPSEYPPSPPLESQWAYHRPPSVDLGRRAEGSRPVTPTTMTSWGPPEEWPPTPTTLSRVSTPDAAQQISSFAAEIGGLVPPQIATIPELFAPWNFVWPYLRLNEPNFESRKPEPRKRVGPYSTAPFLGPLQSRKPLVNVERAAYPIFRICEWFPTFVLCLAVRDSCIDPAVYPHFDIYPSPQGGCVDRSYASSGIPRTLVAQKRHDASPTSSSMLNAASLRDDQFGYPVLNICTYLPAFSHHRLSIIRCSNYYNLDPAIYPHFEIYPKIQTVRSWMEAESGNDADGQMSNLNIPFGSNIMETRPWIFVWPSFQPDSPLVSTPSPISTSIPPLVQKSVMAYPAINICELSLLGIVYEDLD